ncbi:MAG: RluA family pseudouridine synthase [Lachnospiraceae bacterium]|nr:RluA family pseudouridine synthase [Lachnospiraceae bacterium]
MAEIRTYAVEDERDGMRLDRFLAEQDNTLSRSYVQSLIKEKAVSVNGKSCKKCSAPLRSGDEIMLTLPDLKEPDIEPEDMPLSILYEDADFLIVDKPKGLTVHPAPGHMTGTLVNGILAYCGSELSGINGVTRPGIVHRIDKNTTGALIICKNDSAHRIIAEQLKEHSITRRYRGIVCGNIAQDSGTIEGNIGRNPLDRKKMAIVKEGGKSAVTHYRVLEHFRDFCYCEFELETGRTHQIRVHMASIGHPLLGDDVYGKGNSRFRTEGQTLHAMTIGFSHPTTGRYVEYSAPLPEYFTHILHALREGH